MSGQPIAAEPWQLAIVAAILAEHLPAGARVWVFGSRAKPGTPRRGADLDLAIDAGQPLEPHTETMLAEAFTESDLPYTVDIVDLQTASRVFREAIAPDLTPLLVAGHAAGRRETA